MDKINLLIVGEQKCGTHSLKKCLNKHSEINFILDECHAFDATGLNKKGEPKKTFEKYDKYLEKPNFTNAKYRGECTPLYFYNKDSIPNSQKYNSNMKYIVVLRDPVKRAKSAYEMIKRHGAEEATTFELAIQQQLSSLRVEEDTHFKSARKHYIKRGFYIDQLKRMHSLVNKNNVHVVISENLWSDPDTELRKIYNFLGVKNENITFTHENKGQYIKNITPSTEQILKALYTNKNKELADYLKVTLPWSA